MAAPTPQVLADEVPAEDEVIIKGEPELTDPFDLLLNRRFNAIVSQLWF